MSDRDVVLGRIGRALGPRLRDPDATYEDAVARAYRRGPGDRAQERDAGVLDLLAGNLADYRAVVHRVDGDGLADLLARLLAGRGARRVLVPPGLPPSWLAAAAVEQVPDRAADTAYDLDRVDSVVTGCAVAIAGTGTLVLDGSPDQGRRRVTLVPDHHVCVVRVPDQVVASVPEALGRLDPRRPLTWISGPSATSDIELDRVEGVHGPRTLEVVLVSGV
ncbi:LUD domain-containing protein [Streptomyces longispororuber]|uniref:LutC/YkgG family protein n=1 Tax=Streptomyces longispororuber TaxID=68230 RepID=UPI0033E9C382